MCYCPVKMDLKSMLPYTVPGAVLAAVAWQCYKTPQNKNKVDDSAGSDVQTMPAEEIAGCASQATRAQTPDPNIQEAMVPKEELCTLQKSHDEALETVRAMEGQLETLQRDMNELRLTLQNAEEDRSMELQRHRQEKMELEAQVCAHQDKETLRREELCTLHERLSEALAKAYVMESRWETLQFDMTELRLTLENAEEDRSIEQQRHRQEKMELETRVCALQDKETLRKEELCTLQKSHDEALETVRAMEGQLETLQRDMNELRLTLQNAEEDRSMELQRHRQEKMELEAQVCAHQDKETLRREELCTLHESLSEAQAKAYVMESRWETLQFDMTELRLTLENSEEDRSIEQQRHRQEKMELEARVCALQDKETLRKEELCTLQKSCDEALETVRAMEGQRETLLREMDELRLTLQNAEEDRSIDLQRHRQEKMELEAQVCAHQDKETLRREELCTLHESLSEAQAKAYVMESRWETLQFDMTELRLTLENSEEDRSIEQQRHRQEKMELEARVCALQDKETLRKEELCTLQKSCDEALETVRAMEGQRETLLREMDELRLTLQNAEEDRSIDLQRHRQEKMELEAQVCAHQDKETLRREELCTLHESLSEALAKEYVMEGRWETLQFDMDELRLTLKEEEEEKCQALRDTALMSMELNRHRQGKMELEAQVCALQDKETLRKEELCTLQKSCDEALETVRAMEIQRETLLRDMDELRLTLKEEEEEKCQALRDTALMSMELNRHRQGKMELEAQVCALQDKETLRKEELCTLQKSCDEALETVRAMEGQRETLLRDMDELRLTLEEEEEEKCQALRDTALMSMELNRHRQGKMELEAQVCALQDKETLRKEELCTLQKSCDEALETVRAMEGQRETLLRDMDELRLTLQNAEEDRSIELQRHRQEKMELEAQVCALQDKETLRKEQSSDEESATGEWWERRKASFCQQKHGEAFQVLNMQGSNA
ncbi:trichohyalin-like [Amia ocellicauda]|uniref:trichohyalin-like n=1 Tax=Amia ocellicauda TaxID=2972642 RepID=UPI00346423D8